MKTFLSICFLAMMAICAHAQPTWTWLQGDAFTPGYGNYGFKGVADPTNKPGARSGEVTWKDQQGNIWLFGGSGRSATGSGYLNDVWKFSPATRLWTWMNGLPIQDQPGVYGTKGVQAPTNQIRCRSNPVHWIDAAGNLWVFGGQTYNSLIFTPPVSVYLNDLWKYAPATNQWTWMGGDTLYLNVALYPSVFGTKGTASPASKPGSRFAGQGWTDSSGNLWMHGGNGAQRGNFGYLSDLWRYSINTGLWTWAGGDTTVNQTGRYGQQQTPGPLNQPGDRSSATTWTDAGGDLWFFGGTYAYNNPPITGLNQPTVPPSPRNDLWKYGVASGLWTWVSGDTVSNATGTSGTKGVGSVNNKPGSRTVSSEWTDTNGNFWIWGGSSFAGTYSDMWRYTPASSEWTWVSGDTGAAIRKAVYGPVNTPADSVHPVSGSITGSWIDDQQNFWLGNAQQRWRYVPASNQWAWMGGDTSIVPLPTVTIYPAPFGAPGETTPGKVPSARTWGATWRDAQGDLWLYGGFGSDTTRLSSSSTYLRSDLWKYSTAGNQWRWIGGDTAYDRPVRYGVKGVPSDSASPGGRYSAATWTDKGGNFWLFGGAPNGNVGSNDTRNLKGDLWKYTPSTNQWTWVSGDLTSPYSVYTQKAGDTTLPHPGYRAGASSWTDTAGNLWLFGGQGFAAYGLILESYGSYGKLNDLWKFNPSTSTWTFMGGGRTTALSGDGSSQLTLYGTKGVAGTGWPGGRSHCAAWTDNTGNFWLFGGIADISGQGSSGVLTVQPFNDLWKLTPSTSTWTWVGGDNRPFQRGVYRTMGVSDTIGRPGSRRDATGWSDAAGNVYVQGGNSDSTIYNAVTTRDYNDHWRFSPGTGQWTWLGGDAQFDMPGYYGTRNVPSADVHPGGRNGSMSWNDGLGNAWIFGGYGYSQSGKRYLNDLFRFSANVSLPVRFTQFTARKMNETVQLSWTTAQEENSKQFLVERSADGTSFVPIGTVPAKGNSTLPSTYSFTDFLPLLNTNYYRIREVDQDGRFQYTGVQKVSTGTPAGDGFRILVNPVQQQLQVSVRSGAGREISLSIRDLNGHLLFTRSYRLPAGNTLLNIPVQQLPSGMYVLEVQGGQLNGAKKFIKP